MLKWKVSVCSITELEMVLNSYEKERFTIDSYEKITEDYDGSNYCVVGFKEA